MFACHLVRCGGAEEKRKESSIAHITGGSSGLSASVSRILKGKYKNHPQQRTAVENVEKKVLSYAAYYLLFPKLQRALISKELDVGSRIFPLYLFKYLFEGPLLKSFLRCTIFSTPAGHPALLLNICQLLTVFPMLTGFCSLHWINRFFIRHHLCGELV